MRDSTIIAMAIVIVFVLLSETSWIWKLVVGAFELIALAMRFQLINIHWLVPILMQCFIVIVITLYFIYKGYYGFHRR